MEDAPYSKREQDKYLSDITKQLDSQDTVLSRIEGQTKLTNGRVSKIENWANDVKPIVEAILRDNEKLKTDRTRIYTIISVMTVVGAGVLFLYARVIDLKIKADIPVAIDSALDARFSKIQITQ